LKDKFGRPKSQLRIAGLQPRRYTQAHNGQHIIIKDRNTDQYYSATIRIKAVRCNKPNCHKCPHHSYAYAQFRDGARVREKYLGVVR